MNYRHAFHAGNFADVVKHVMLTRILSHLLEKPKPFRVIDTHAGTGRYDLAGDEAGRTGEWHDGIGRMGAPFPDDVEALLAPYRSVVAATRDAFGPDAYPGSPAIIRRMLRPEDRAILVEKHPDDSRMLRERFNSYANCKVLPVDGWEALPGLIPPKERRGLVLIDPPYEEPGEFAAALRRIGAAMRRWPTGIVALWYPIKDPDQTDAEFARAERFQELDSLAIEVFVQSPSERRDRLNGSGLLVVNPPWRLEGEARLLLPALGMRLSRADWSDHRIVRHGSMKKPPVR